VPNLRPMRNLDQTLKPPRMTSEIKLRAAIQRERGLIAALQSKVSEPALRKILRDASSLIDLAEGCIEPKAMAQSRSHADLAWWLGRCEALLEPATLQRECVESIVKKFGFDVRSFPS
jgi:hypothetical protein